MTIEKLHPNEADISISLVSDLLNEQFPQWSNLPIHLITASGTDNALFKLGDDFVVRLPRMEGAMAQISQDRTWLPKLASKLPVVIPEQMALGEPSAEYPFSWSVYRWIGGETADIDSLPQPEQTAGALASFIKSLRAIDPTNGPMEGYRGRPVHLRDQWTRESINELANLIDTQKAIRIWEETIEAADWDGPPTWFHGDLMPGNLLFEDDKLKAIIDWGVMGVGDPAIDLIVAWFLLPPPSRAIFREEMGVSEDEWLRGRGWALSIAAGYIPYYRHTQLPGVGYCRRALIEILNA